MIWFPIIKPWPGHPGAATDQHPEAGGCPRPCHAAQSLDGCEGEVSQVRC